MRNEFEAMRKQGEARIAAMRTEGEARIEAIRKEGEARVEVVRKGSDENSSSWSANCVQHIT